jgi:hypothetical protein
MKRTLSLLALFALAVLPARAQVLLFDNFSYPDGNITNTSGGLWKNHSGAGTDSLISNGVYQVSQLRSDDVNRTFAAQSNGAVYASFILNVKTLPGNAGGAYFAHFKDNTTNAIPQFTGRFSVVSTNAFPGTYRLGAANTLGDFTGPGTGPSKVVPQDLATNTDYQVVVKFDIGAGLGSASSSVASLWVNPAVEADFNVQTGAGDTTLITNAIGAFAFRQATGEGVMTVDNLIVGNTFADVVTNAVTIPVIGLQPAGASLYSGNDYTMEVAASGAGALTYQWNKDGTPIPGATSAQFTLSNPQGTDQGDYSVTVGNTAGGTNSSNAFVAVNTTPTAPSFITQPQSRTNTVTTTATLTAVAVGTGPLAYQWNKDSSPISGATSTDLILANLGVSDSGVYTCDVIGGFGSATSQPATLTVQLPQLVSMGFLRTLLDTNTWLTTDTTSLWTVKGILTVATNQVNNQASYYIQDATGGLNLFITLGTAFRPQLGDEITATGVLSSFSSNLEILLNLANAYNVVVTNSHNNPLPAPKVIPVTLTSNLPAIEAIEGSLIMLTNVYFTNAAGAKFPSAAVTYTVTNKNGQPFQLRVNAPVTDLATKNVPSFAYSVVGVLIQNLNNANTPRNTGYQIQVSRYADIVTTAPPAVTLSGAHSGNNTVLTWTAVPYNYSYSILAASDVAGPYTPLASGLVFTNAAATYTDTNAVGSAKYYRISVP